MKSQSSNSKRRRYDAEFKENILKLNAQGRSVSSLSASFGVSESVIHRWKSEQREQGISLGQSEESELLAEVKRLRSQLREVEQERDILKKALGIFSRTI